MLDPKWRIADLDVNYIFDHKASIAPGEIAKITNMARGVSLINYNV